MSTSTVNLAERVRAAVLTSSAPWTLEQIARSTHEALSRWQTARQHLGIKFGFPPRIENIAPEFVLSPELELLAPSDLHFRFVVLAFLAWATCPVTRDIPNPIEPMLDVLHHGGSFSTEHGYIDVYAADGSRCGIPMHRYANAA